MKPVLERARHGPWHSTGAADFTGLSPQAGCIWRSSSRRRRSRSARRARSAPRPPPSAVYPAVAPSTTRSPSRFNRPYLLLVSAKATGEPLFLAKVDNPTAS